MDTAHARRAVLFLFRRRRLASVAATSRGHAPPRIAVLGVAVGPLCRTGLTRSSSTRRSIAGVSPTNASGFINMPSASRICSGSTPPLPSPHRASVRPRKRPSSVKPAASFKPAGANQSHAVPVPRIHPPWMPLAAWSFQVVPPARQPREPPCVDSAACPLPVGHRSSGW